MKENIYYRRMETLWKSMGFDDANEFAKSIGWDRAEKILRLNRKDNFNKKPGIDILKDIANYHLDYDFRFLLTGKKNEANNMVNDAPVEYITASTSPKKNTCTNPVCLAEKIKLLQENRQLQKEKIKWLEEQKGDTNMGKKFKGGVEKTKQTGT